MLKLSRGSARQPSGCNVMTAGVALRAAYRADRAGISLLLLLALALITAVSPAVFAQETARVYPIRHFLQANPMGTGYQNTMSGAGAPGIVVQRSSAGMERYSRGFARFDLRDFNVGFEDINSVVLSFHVTGPDAKVLRVIAITGSDSAAGYAVGNNPPNPKFMEAFDTHSDAAAMVNVTGPGWYGTELNAVVGLPALGLGMGRGWLGIGFQAVEEIGPDYNTSIAGRPFGIEPPDSTTPYLEIQYTVGVAEEKSLPVAGHRFTVGPNPVTGGIATLRLEGLGHIPRLTVKVYDAAGRSVLARQLTVVSRSAEIPLDLRELSNGVYLVRIQADGVAMKQKLVIRESD